jgi:hypothetical protein
MMAGGKHNKGCCEPCYLFRDDFDRADTTNLGSDWEECVGDWEIDTGELTTTSGAGSVVVLKHMVGNPVGFLRGEAKFLGCTGAIYRIYVFYGSQATPCSGGSDYIIEIEVTDDNHGIVRILGGDSDQESNVWIDQEDELEFQVCISNETIEITTDARTTTFVHGNGFLITCGVDPTHYWFALGSNSSTQGYWLWIEYQDHYDHDRTCPACRKSTCFGLDNRAIRGFDFRIDGIGDGDRCTCPSYVEFTIMVPDGINPCGGDVDSDNETIAYPGGGFNCGTMDAIWIMHCDEFGITVGLTLQPLVGTTIEWFMTFPFGTLIEDVAVAGEPVNDAGDGKACDYGSATLTMTPIIGDSCCGTTTPVLPLLWFLPPDEGGYGTESFISELGI